MPRTMCESDRLVCQTTRCTCVQAIAIVRCCDNDRKKFFWDNDRSENRLLSCDPPAIEALTHYLMLGPDNTTGDPNSSIEILRNLTKALALEIQNIEPQCGDLSFRWNNNSTLEMKVFGGQPLLSSGLRLAEQALVHEKASSSYERSRSPQQQGLRLVERALVHEKASSSYERSRSPQQQGLRLVERALIHEKASSSYERSRSPQQQGLRLVERALVHEKASSSYERSRSPLQQGLRLVERAHTRENAYSPTEVENLDEYAPQKQPSQLLDLKLSRRVSIRTNAIYVRSRSPSRQGLGIAKHAHTCNATPDKRQSVMLHPRAKTQEEALANMRRRLHSHLAEKLEHSSNCIRKVCISIS